jgi:hypothetical protein
MLLGDLGAEVIKVERPGEGDDTRAFAPPFQGDQANTGGRSLGLGRTTNVCFWHLDGVIGRRLVDS